MKLSNINKKFSRRYFQSIAFLFILGNGSMLSAIGAEMSMDSEPNKAMMAPMKSGSMQGGSAPADARDPNAHSGGYEYRHMAGWEDTDEITIRKIIIDQIEYQGNDGNDTLGWDMQGWKGTDYKKIWLKFEGENETSAKIGELELQIIYSQTFSAFWDFQVGARYDRSYSSDTSENRFFAVVGIQGLAPYWFEVEPAVFISDNGDLSARLVSTYDLLFSQRLILQPRFEINAATSQVREFGLGKGINDIQFDLRLRYEVRRKLAPYLGLSWIKKMGDTADLAQANGEDATNLAAVVGVRLWF